MNTMPVVTATKHSINIRIFSYRSSQSQFLLQSRDILSGNDDLFPVFQLGLQTAVKGGGKVRDFGQIHDGGFGDSEEISSLQFIHQLVELFADLVDLLFAIGEDLIVDGLKIVHIPDIQ